MVEGISGEVYSSTNNRPLLKLWDSHPFKLVHWTDLRSALIEEGVPAAIIARIGPREAFVIAALADGCPAHTLPPNYTGVYFALREWGIKAGRL